MHCTMGGATSRFARSGPEELIYRIAVLPELYDPPAGNKMSSSEYAAR